MSYIGRECWVIRSILSNQHFLRLFNIIDIVSRFREQKTALRLISSLFYRQMSHEDERLSNIGCQC